MSIIKENFNKFITYFKQKRKKIISIFFVFFLTFNFSYAEVLFLKAYMLPALYERIEYHLYAALKSTRDIISKDTTGLSLIYNHLRTNNDLIIKSFSDVESRREFTTLTKQLINGSEDIKNLIYKLKSHKETVGIQYLYVFIPIFVDNEIKTVFVLDADMLEGDEIYPGYQLETNNMQPFLNVVNDQKIHYGENEDEWGKHYSVTGPLNDYNFASVYIGLDYDLHGNLFNKVNSMLYIILIPNILLCILVIIYLRGDKNVVQNNKK